MHGSPVKFFIGRHGNRQIEPEAPQEEVEQQGFVFILQKCFHGIIGLGSAEIGHFLGALSAGVFHAFEHGGIGFTERNLQ